MSGEQKEDAATKRAKLEVDAAKYKSWGDYQAALRQKANEIRLAEAQAQSRQRQADAQATKNKIEIRRKLETEIARASGGREYRVTQAEVDAEYERQKREADDIEQAYR